MLLNTTRLEAWAWIGGGLVLSAIVALAAHALLYRLLGRLARRRSAIVDDAVVARTHRPTRVLLPLLACAATLDTNPLTEQLPEALLLRHYIGIAVILAFAWVIVALINSLTEIVEHHYRIDVADNLEARRIRTQVELLERITVGVVGVIALAAVLMSFPSVRQIGLSLFASAGVAGLVLGVAARPTLGNVIAGLQVAIAQPIRIDDVVVVEGEWGRIEEITTTFVVIRIWDERRLVVPITYFIEKPFANWTRTGAGLLGTVFLYADYRVDVDAVRAELDRVVRGTELWDGRVALLQVTDATDRAIQLRALVSASSSGVAFDLRCLVRERLVAFLREQSAALPLLRAELGNGAYGSGARTARDPA